MSREVSILLSKPGTGQLWTSSAQNQDVTTQEKKSWHSQGSTGYNPGGGAHCTRGESLLETEVLKEFWKEGLKWRSTWGSSLFRSVTPKFKETGPPEL